MASDPQRSALARVPGAPPWWLAGIAAVVLVATTLDIANHGILTHLDHAVSRRMIAWDLRNNHGFKPFLYVLTMFGQRGPVLAVTIALICYLTWRARRSEFLLRYVLAIALLTLVVYAFKGTLTTNPPIVEPGKVNRAESYPSGHIVNAIMTWGVVAWSASRVMPAAALTTVLRVVWLIAPWAVVVGMTLLDYHWVSDFIGGAAIGLVLLPIVLHPIWTDVAARVDRRLPTRASAR